MVDIEKVAKAARLTLTEEEKKKFSKEIEEVLHAFEKIEKLDISEEPSFQPLEVKDVTREDKEEECLTQEEALSNTENKEKGFFKGPKVIDK
jgi:aspartyl-tRNA(Asn)/glutamyl-tRNA(Gln) amidotransferase subunit C